ncbi:MAG: hypothetical protein AAF490_26545 [Chloroflexota bacterium]
MNIRCSYCNANFNLGRDYVIESYNEAVSKKQKYHQVECIKCRKQIKVPLKQMKRYMPRQQPAEEEGKAETK